MKERLQKVMAHAGVASRRKSEEMIEAGRVKVNGKTITELGFKVGPEDAIEVDGKGIIQENHIYILLNKPAGVVSTAKDDKGRTTVVDLIEGIQERIYPVGRLDYDTTGAIILTNDGEFANLLTHPRYETKKTYQALVEGELTVELASRLRKGVDLEDGMTYPAKVKLLKYDKAKNRSLVQLTIHEGRYHQVKRMFAAVGLPLISLHRLLFAGLDVAKLRPGEWRYLKAIEVRDLKEKAKEL